MGVRMEIRERAFLRLAADLRQGIIWKAMVITLAETPAGDMETEVDRQDF